VSSSAANDCVGYAERLEFAQHDRILLECRGDCSTSIFLVLLSILIQARVSVLRFNTGGNTPGALLQSPLIMIEADLRTYSKRF
jgi:hypothetical protein